MPKGYSQSVSDTLQKINERRLKLLRELGPEYLFNLPLKVNDFKALMRVVDPTPGRPCEEEHLDRIERCLEEHKKGLVSQ